MALSQSKFLSRAFYKAPISIEHCSTLTSKNTLCNVILPTPGSTRKRCPCPQGVLLRDDLIRQRRSCKNSVNSGPTSSSQKRGQLTSCPRAKFLNPTRSRGPPSSLWICLFFAQQKGNPQKRDRKKGSLRKGSFRLKNL